MSYTVLCALAQPYLLHPLIENVTLYPMGLISLEAAPTLGSIGCTGTSYGQADPAEPTVHKIKHVTGHSMLTVTPGVCSRGGRVP